MEVTLKAEISKLAATKEQLEEKLKEANDEIQRQTGQITALIGKPLTDVEKREELEITRQMRIGDLEEQLARSEAEKSDCQEQLFKAQEQLLDLKFEKETFDLQYARLQKRIQDLDQYKMSTASLSAKFKQQLAEQ